eukprot:SAG31_NODE_16972_length_688_cov_1.003396_1_plen_181_part_10
MAAIVKGVRSHIRRRCVQVLQVLLATLLLAAASMGTLRMLRHQHAATVLPAALHVALKGDAWVVGARLAVLAPASYGVGLAFGWFRLPAITGYICTGLCVGPHGLDLVSPRRATGLWIAEALCLAIIAFAAGSELDLEELQRQCRPVFVIASGITFCTWLCVFTGFVAAAQWLPLPAVSNS